MAPHEISVFKNLAGNLGAIFAITSPDLTQVKFSTTQLTSIAKNHGAPPSDQPHKRSTSNSPQVEMEVVSITMKGRKKAVDAVKFSRYIPSRKERICILFEMQHLIRGYKGLEQLMPETNGKTDVLEKFLSLSHRERQVAGLVGSGLTSREVAEILHISENTVKNHRKRLKKRLNYQDANEYKGFLIWASMQ